jgi:hypothetical protein
MKKGKTGDMFDEYLFASLINSTPGGKSLKGLVRKTSNKQSLPLVLSDSKKMNSQPSTGKGE